MNDTRTNTEDVEAESVVHRLVDQLVRHAVKPHMTCQGDSTSTLTLKKEKRNQNKTSGVCPSVSDHVAL